ncbi:MAG: universal stress protein [Reichenbachiella sp.]|uniref:universal stress protein n=1 Tax=Reichenbachiella sp. TaxID=2184521 RepID=UPI00326476E1
MQTIAVPYDKSDFAKAALDFAVQIAETQKAKIKLIHVIEYPLATTFNVSGEIESYDPMDKIFTLELINKAKETLNLAIEPYTNRVEIDPVMLMGNPYDGITSEIENVQADLIVMGTKGATGLKELLVGSNTEKIVRNAHCPVLAIHSKCDFKEIKNIIFASDLDGSHGDVLDTFVEYQEMFGAKIHLVWVETPYNSINEDLGKERLETIAKDHALSNYEVHVVKAFKPEDGILSYGWQINADMIAMSTHSHKGLLHLFAGSVAEDVVNHSNLPVWTCSIK